MKIILIGIGQSLRGDDAAGLEAVRVWQKLYPASASLVSVEICELPGLALLDLLEGMEAAILVDALHDPATPGRVVRLGPYELASFTSDSQSAHGWGVAETLSLGRWLYPSLEQCRISLIGISGSQFGMGKELSPEVRAAIGEAAEYIEAEVQALFIK
jgi:hydrogenase maturation protease